MPQARRGGPDASGSGGSSRSGSPRSGSRRSTTKDATTKRAPAPKRAAAPKSASGTAAKPATSRSTAKPAASRASAKSTQPAAKAAPKRAAMKTSPTQGGGSRSAAPKAATAAAGAVGVDFARVEAIAKRLRTLNERIIEAGREAGDGTLASYEKALKAIASGLQSGPGRSEVDWISHLATTQAKFLRELTDHWTSAARDLLK
jgi:hypothetical protein